MQREPASLSSGPHIKGSVIVDSTAKIGENCIIGPDVSIGPNCVIGNGVRLANCVVMQGCQACPSPLYRLRSSWFQETQMHDHNNMGTCAAGFSAGYPTNTKVPHPCVCLNRGERLL